jgi:hypothetical protein
MLKTRFDFANRAELLAAFPGAQLWEANCMTGDGITFEEWIVTMDEEGEDERRITCFKSL